MDIVDVEEPAITRAIITKGAQALADLADTDVIIVGAGPAGMTAAMYLAKAGIDTVIFERRLSFGGGIGGGGMLFPRLTIQSPADKILRDVGCKRLEEVGKGFYVGDTAEMMAKLASGAIDAGANIILGIVVDDLMYRADPTPRITGAVIQWTAVTMAGIHVDPLGLKAKAVVDATGHDAEIIAIAARKIPELGISVSGEKAMWVPVAERLTVENTGAVCPGLYATGMAVTAVHNTPRMGPVFGGMLLSGAKVANIIAKDILGEKAVQITPVAV